MAGIQPLSAVVDGRGKVFDPDYVFLGVGGHGITGGPAAQPAQPPPLNSAPRRVPLDSCRPKRDSRSATRWRWRRQLQPVCHRPLRDLDSLMDYEGRSPSAVP